MRQKKKKKKEIREKKRNERLIKDRIIRDIMTLFEQEKEVYYKSKIVSNFWNNLIVIQMKLLIYFVKGINKI